MVGLDRFELSASSLSGTRSNQLSYKPSFESGWLEFGGDDRDRTDDLRLAKAALSQLSYVPPLVMSMPSLSGKNKEPRGRVGPVGQSPALAKQPRANPCGAFWG